MDKIAIYQNAITALLKEYAAIKDIVLGFVPPYERAHTCYAEA